MTLQKASGGDTSNLLLRTIPSHTFRLTGKGSIPFLDRKGCLTSLASLVVRLFLVLVLTSYSNCILVFANIGTGLDLCIIAPRTINSSRWNRVRANRFVTAVLNFIGQINKLILCTVHGNKTSNVFANLIFNVKASSIVRLCVGVRITLIWQPHRHRHLRILKRNDWCLIGFLSLNISPSIGTLGTAVVGTLDGKLNDELLATSLIFFIKTTPVPREIKTSGRNCLATIFILS